MTDDVAADQSRVKDFLKYTGGYVWLDAPTESDVDENLIHFRGWLLEKDSPITFSINGRDVQFITRVARPDAEICYPDLSPIGFEFWIDLVGYVNPGDRALHLVARCGRGVVGEWRRRAARQRNRPAPTLIYMIHVPKTAGTAIRSQLQRASDYLEVLYVYDTSPYLPALQAPLLSEQALEKYDLVYGHFRYEAHQALRDRPYKYITVLRDPTKYIASIYLFYKYTSNEHTYRSIQDFVDDAPMYTIDNKFCRMLTAAADDELITEEHLQRAIRNIEEDFLYVGLHEELTESLRRISALLGVDLVQDLERENTSDSYDEGRLIDMAELRAATERYTRFDRALYAYVSDKFFCNRGASTPLLVQGPDVASLDSAPDDLVEADQPGDVMARAD